MLKDKKILINDAVFSFQAVQIQLGGPVPSVLYHRYVEFRPFVAGMFTAGGIRGRLLNHALHHQHARIYAYDRYTEYGVFPEPSIELSKQFLDFVHYGQGGRIFTYVLTTDGQWRFTETGKEFGVDLLSKHTMHSDVSIYIAYSGEFLVRRVHHHHHHHHHHEHRRQSGSSTHGDDSAAPQDQGVSRTDTLLVASEEPSDYELVIDNDSGTYRPNARLLPQLQQFLSRNLPGLNITALDCQHDEKLLADLKQEQRDKKQATGRPITYLQRRSSSLSSFSSSDEEALDEAAAERTEGGGSGKPMRRFRRMKDPKARYKQWLDTGHTGLHPPDKKERPASA